VHRATDLHHGAIGRFVLAQLFRVGAELAGAG
jgi:hypothetical protein